MKRLLKLLFWVFLFPILLIMLLFLFALAMEKYTSIRNYYGYCASRYASHRLTTEERLDIAIDHYLLEQINMDYKEILKAEYPEYRGYGTPEDLKERFTLITYGDKDEFLQANPGCCKRTWDLSWPGRRRRAEEIGRASCRERV